MNSNQPSKKCFHIFYSKDIHKKKKVYKEGVLLVGENTAKIFDEDGLLVISFKNKEQVNVDEEYTINNAYLVTVDRVGDMEEYSTGAIFTKKQLVVLPIKKKVMSGLNSKTTKLDDLMQLKCGLYIQKNLYEILRQHQKQGVQFMYECVSGRKNSALHGCILADYMGLGKTLQTLALAYSMIKQKQIKKFAIVCPLTLLDVWQKQTKKWLQQKIIPLVCYGDGSETTNTVKKFAEYEYRMLVISYQTFYKNIQKLSGKCDLIIFDEGHRMKNKKSKLLLKLKTFKCEKRILLTGTPIQNNLQQLYTCVSIINPKMFGNQILFKNIFQKPILDGLGKKATFQQKQLAKKRTAQLARQLKQFSLRRTADVLNKFLPPRYEHLIFLKLTPLQNLWYERIIDENNAKQDDMFKKLNFLRKLFIHPSILKMNKINNGNFDICSQDANQQFSFKIQFTLGVVSQCVQKHQKCVIVSYYTETLDFIGNILKGKGISYAKLDGRQSTDQRKISIMKFQKDFTVLLLSGKAGGTGLTLICAVKMIMIEPDWNPSNDSQVMGRIWRQGQTNEVHIYRLLIASTFQQKMLQRQRMKKTLSNNLIDNQEQYNNEVDYDNIAKLFVKNKNQVLTYKINQNQMKSFFQNQENIVNEDNGIIFIKTISSSNNIQQNNQKGSINQALNEFTNIGIQNFIEKQQGFTQEGCIDDYEKDEEQDQFNNIQQIQKIKIKKNRPKQIKNQNQKQATNQQTGQIKQNDQFLNQTQTQSQSDKMKNMTNLIKESKQQKNENKISQAQFITKKNNSKTDTTSIAPLNLLKKIVKK